MLWLQPLAMICGVVMMSAITYVTLSTGERPFTLIMKRVSPVLEWAWLIATIIANLVFSLPQFSLATGAIQQNLAPEITGSWSPYLICVIMFAACAVVVTFYRRGGLGVKLFERILKIMVGVIIVSFVGVTVVLIAKGAVNIGEVLKGHIPNFSYFTHPTPVFAEAIAQTGDKQALWTGLVTGEHAGRMIAAFGTAVGINMTFLLPYSMLNRRWGKKHRAMAIFDLSLGLIIPFVIATGCLVIAAASQFHGRSNDILDEKGMPYAKTEKVFNASLDGLLVKMVEEKRADSKEEALSMVTLEDRKLAAMLAARDVGSLAASLEPFTGKFLAQKIFGLGVVGMAISSIIMLMLINAFAATEAFGRPDDARIHYAAAMMPGIVGCLYPLIWQGASKAALVVPAATIAGGLIPIAYFTFLLLMNSRPALGSELPSGGRRMVWNTLMIFSTSLVTYGVLWVTSGNAAEDGFQGIMAKIMLVTMAVLFVLGLLGFLRRNRATS